jgi:hypothetical protein
MSFQIARTRLLAKYLYGTSNCKDSFPMSWALSAVDTVCGLQLLRRSTDESRNHRDLKNTLPSMSDSLEFPSVTGQDILNCSFSSWYTKYHRLSPRARIIKPLPEAFLNFLKADGIILPGGWVPTVERANSEELYKSHFRDRGSR